ncbi:MAG: hypothetical protein HOB79_12900 [Rhodospirillaceae bacterium]|jgi:hypothetical protein|nr:hypothetical protein [Rhodospirillales bacterium]MBT3907249.1 hypothetical protein [Rhodospirillaceae bacterium]MBT4701960.1 hypothetical protein [Rhodospirillaceae bacterium]MBT5036758.1 hypothetical protein [Rhodospirillaceae bacterium]MBT6220349.1 hypothetical protein [Rhodospirillaceae bacterium]
MTTIKIISALFATAMLFQTASVEAADTRVGGVRVSENGAGEYRRDNRARARKPWELDRPRYRERHHGRSHRSSSNNNKGFEHTISSEYTYCRRKQFGRGAESCGLRVWVDIKTDEQRSFRANVSCTVQIEMTYEGDRVFTRTTWHDLDKTAWMYDGSGYVYMRKRIYGERMHERLIDADVVRTSCSVYRA